MIQKLFSLIGSSFLISGIISAVLTQRFTSIASRTEGKIIWKQASHIVVQFTPSSKSVETFYQSGYFYGAVGDRVSVLYTQSSEKFDASIDTIGGLWGGSIFCTAIGIILLFGGQHVRRELMSRR